MPLPDRYPCRRPVPWRVIDAEALVVDPRAGRLYPLNSVAARIWQLCDGAHSVEAIGRTVLEEFDADEPTVRRDTARFLDDLAAAGLITLADAPAPPSTGARRGAAS